MGRAGATLAGVGAALGVAAPAASAVETITVNSTADPGDGFCNAAECTLREAVGETNDLINIGGNDEIVFAASLSGDTITINDDGIEVTDSVTIDGSTIDESPIINGNSGRIFYVSDIAPQDPTVFRDLVLVNGAGITAAALKVRGTPVELADSLVTSSQALTAGGAITVYDTDLSITGSSLIGNRVIGGAGGQGGGAIFADGASLTITGSRFAGNNTDGLPGGAIRLTDGSSAQITGTTLEGNYTAGDAAQGGAIRADDTSSVTITDSVLTGNHTLGNFSFGGAIKVIHGSPVTITNSLLQDNYTAGASGAGGTIHSGYESAVTVTGSTISGSSTGSQNSRGGSIYARNFADGAPVTPLTITNTTISGSSTAGENSSGGAIFASGAIDVGLTNSTLAGNSTGGVGSHGGALALGGEVGLQADSATVSGNTALANGGGLFQYVGGAGALVNTIVAGNAASTAPDARASLELTSSIIGEQAGIAIEAQQDSQLGVDPLLGPLANNGGPTATMLPQEGSPAIDAGATGLHADQRGVARPLGAGDDVGAVEFSPPPLDEVPPGLTLERKGKARAGKALRVRVTSDEDALAKVSGKQVGRRARSGSSAELSATIAAKRKVRVKLEVVRLDLAAGQREVVKLKPAGKKGRKAARKLRRIVKRGGKAKAKLKLVATDAASNRGRARLKLKLE